MLRLRRFAVWLQCYGLIAPVTLLLISVVGLLVYTAATFGIRREEERTISVEMIITLAPPSTPAARLARLDPEARVYLEQQPDYAPIPLDLLAVDLPPIGVFFPETGSNPPITPQPSGMIYPTSPPMPTLILPTRQPTARPTIGPTATPLPPMYVITSIPTIEPTATTDLVATVLAFATSVTPGDPFINQLCAPAGKPAEGLLTQRFHPYHTGVDWGIPLGTPILATHSGFITWADWNTFGYGNLVIVQSSSFITYYGHLTSFNVILGQYVTQGSIIGWSGSTGNSSGPHIHYETRIDDVPVDPLTFESRGYFSC